MIRKFKFLNMTYDIKLQDLKKEDYSGRIYFEKKLIVIDRNLPFNEQLGTLLHELNHLFFRIYYPTLTKEEVLIDQLQMFQSLMINQIVLNDATINKLKAIKRQNRRKKK